MHFKRYFLINNNKSTVQKICTFAHDSDQTKLHLFIFNVLFVDGFWTGKGQRKGH